MELEFGATPSGFGSFNPWVTAVNLAGLYAMHRTLEEG